MSEAAQRASAYATIALGASQALAPKQAGKAFGLGEIDDGLTLWLARLLGIANIGLGAVGLNPETRAATRPISLGLLGANAAVTAVAASTGKIPARTAISVLAFVAVLVPGVLSD